MENKITHEWIEQQQEEEYYRQLREKEAEPNA